MCGRYYRRSEKQEIATRFKLGELGDFPLPPDFNIAPTTFQPIIRLNRNTGEREMVQLRWGLIPSFAKSLSDFKGVSTINARAESIATSGIWRVPFQRHRCLVPADGFYEWKKTIVGERGRMGKQPFAFSLKDGDLFAFAGLWDAWRKPYPPSDKSVHTTHCWLQSFAIITTEANELMAPVHTRMPVILHRRDWEEWLARNDSGDPRPGPLHLLRAYESDDMTADACNPLVGNVRNNGPQMLSAPLNSA